MKRNSLIIILILAVALLISGCDNKDKAAEQATEAPTQPMPMEPTQIPVPEFDMELPEGYDPSTEEDPGSIIGGDEAAAADVHIYAGSSPIPIDPVDMPSPTPRQALAFTYAKYTADKLGLSFESVAGYDVDDSQENVYRLIEPAGLVKDNYAVEISLSFAPITKNYSINNVRTDLRSTLDNLGKVNYKTWEATGTSKRSLLGKDGYYGNYRGVLFDGTIVRGRVHMAIVNDKLLTLHVSCPGWYNTDYMGVYSHIRSTLKLL
ncbi:MAG: hypothetical protein GX337_00920 [Christensenellaceae bacterium]|nr:hypothetical protein [Christensenellaceae bacterium]